MRLLVRLLVTPSTQHLCCFMHHRSEPIKFKYYPDGEVRCEGMGDYSGEDIVIIYATEPGRNLHTSLFELLLILHMLDEQGAKSITVLFTYLAYLRQDKVETHGLNPLALMKRLFSLFESVQFFVLDPHSDVALLRVQGLSLWPFYEQIIAQHFPKALLVAPDKGRHDYVHAIATSLGMEAVLMDKSRKNLIKIHCDTPQKIRGRDCVIIDDIIDSGTTLLTVSCYLKREGATKTTALITHNLARPSVLKKLKQRGVDVFYTDSLPPKEGNSVLSLGDFLNAFLEDQYNALLPKMKGFGDVMPCDIL